MNFNRFSRPGMFDFRRDPQPPANPNDSTNRLSTPNQSQTGTSILTRPRAGNVGPGGLDIKPRREQVDDLPSPGTADSLTLGQLKGAIAEKPPKPKIQQWDYRYEDSDTIMKELEEFYPYVENEQIGKGLEAFVKENGGDWKARSPKAKKQYVESQLEYLESPVYDTRRGAQQRLLYLLHGNFGESTGPETQLHSIIENAKLVRSVDGVSTLVVALVDASSRFTNASSSEKPKSTGTGSNIASSSNIEGYNETSAEVMDLLAMLYFMVEVHRSDESFGDELMAMDPPLPLVLFSIIASQKDKFQHRFPLKKTLLLFWKTLLACLGGMKDINKAKSLARELAGLTTDGKNFTKASPMDITTWRRDTSVKYPTFAPPSSLSTPIPNEQLSDGVKPIPARPNYHTTELPPAPPPRIKPKPIPQPALPAQSVNSALQPGTPAPTPPGSPQVKPKKQQFQTDPSKPFVFPYSRSNGLGSLVPFAISEADRLYHRHAYVSLGLYQLWEVREECMREERGLGKGGLIGFEYDGDGDEEGEEEMEAMRREWRYEAEERDCVERGDKEGARRARDKRAASKRLHRVEVMYRNILPSMQSFVIVILKLLLGAVTGSGQPPLQNGLPPGLTSPAQEAPPAEPAPPPTTEEIDTARNREVTCKAVSAVLILLLKWLKASHILKSQYLGQLLFDSNCLLLVLKMYGLADIYTTVQAKNDVEDLNFFRYCRLNHSKAPPSPEQSPIPPLPPPPALPNPKDDKDKDKDQGKEETEIETMSYSSRNFFSSINFLKVLQKMTKHRSHRTYLLNQYKSSQILKRMLRVNHPMLQLQILKLIKSQMPWCGRKWRQVNMKVITAIYLNCRPELRDEWLGGTDQEIELEDALPQEYALRHFIAFYNNTRYSAPVPHISSPEPSHKRSNSTSATTLEDPALLPLQSKIPHLSLDTDTFPPRQTDVVGAQTPEVEFWLHEYEDVLGEVFGEGREYADGRVVGVHELGGRGRDDVVWRKLGEIMRGRRGSGEEESVSDGESVGSIGELGEGARLGEEDGIEGEGAVGGGEIVGVGVVDVAEEIEGVFARQQDSVEGDKNTWEAMSPRTLSLLRSPADRRRSSSSGSPLRPVISSGPMDSSPFDDELEDRGPGPMPIQRETADERDREFGAVDEVEYAYGE